MPKTTHSNLKLPTTIKNESSTTHHHPKYIHYHLPHLKITNHYPTPSTSNQSLKTTTHNHPKYTLHHSSHLSTTHYCCYHIHHHSWPPKTYPSQLTISKVTHQHPSPLKINLPPPATTQKIPTTKIVWLLLGLTVRVLGPIITEMKTQSLTHCTFILKENALKNLMAMSPTGHL